MKHIYISKDLNHLFIFCGSEIPEFGFDLLYDSECFKINDKDLIKVDINNKLFTSLIKDDEFKVNFAESLFNTVSECAAFVDMSDRTYYRIRSLINK